MFYLHYVFYTFPYSRFCPARRVLLKSSVKQFIGCKNQVETQKEINTHKLISNRKFLRTTYQLYSGKLIFVHTPALPNPPSTSLVWKEAFSYSIEKSACICFQLLTRFKCVPSGCAPLQHPKIMVHADRSISMQARSTHRLCFKLTYGSVLKTWRSSGSAPLSESESCPTFAEWESEIF